MLQSCFRSIGWVFFLATVACFMACRGGAAPEVESAAQIDAARTAFWEAHEAGDAIAMANACTEDAVLWAPGMDEVLSRASIQSVAEGMFAAMSISDFAIESREIQIYDDTAYELATYSQTVTPEGGEPSTVRGRYVIVWKRDSEDRWLVHRNMFHFITGG